MVDRKKATDPVMLKARQRIIEEIALQLTVAAVNEEGADGVPIPRSWFHAAEDLKERMIDFVGEQTQLEEQSIQPKPYKP